MALTGTDEVAVRSLVAWVRARFGDRTRELTLFGSKARDEADEDSDVDVLVVVDELTGAEAREVGHYCGDLLTEHDVIVSAFAVSTAHMQQLRDRERLIAAEIARDGVPL